jgi:hypothetical protein
MWRASAVLALVPCLLFPLPGVTAGDGSCGGVAPVVHECDLGPDAVWATLEWGPTFTGRLRLDIEHATHTEVGMFCDVLLGLAITCVASPSVGLGVALWCRTATFGTDAPGGVGAWSCTGHVPL